MNDALAAFIDAHFKLKLPETDDEDKLGLVKALRPMWPWCLPPPIAAAMRSSPKHEGFVPCLGSVGWRGHGEKKWTNLREDAIEIGIAIEIEIPENPIPTAISISTRPSTPGLRRTKGCQWACKP